MTGARGRAGSNFWEDHRWFSVAGWKKLCKDLDFADLDDGLDFWGDGDGDDEGIRFAGA